MALKLEIEVSDKGSAKIKSMAGDLRSVDKEAKKTSNSIKSSFDNLKSSYKKLKSNWLEIVGVIYTAKKAFDLFIGSAAEFQQEEKKMEAVLKSTNEAAGMGKIELLNLADSLQTVTRYSNTSIMSVENLILTFTNISKKIMPDTIETVLNMSTALGQDLKSSAIQLGKALNDPITGATALRRVGVNLNEQQMEQIKTLVKQNDLYGAQKLILDELAVEFGGVARAATDTFNGALAQTGNIISDFARSIGDKALPGVTDLTKGVGEFFLKLQETTLETTIRQLKEMGVEAQKIADLQFLSDWNNATEALLHSNEKIEGQLKSHALEYKRISELSDAIEIKSKERFRAKTQETTIEYESIIDKAKLQEITSDNILKIMERIRQNLNDQINYKDGINGIEGQIVIKSSKQMAILGDLLKLTSAKESAERLILGLKKQQNQEDDKTVGKSGSGNGNVGKQKIQFDIIKELKEAYLQEDLERQKEYDEKMYEEMINQFTKEQDLEYQRHLIRQDFNEQLKEFTMSEYDLRREKIDELAAYYRSAGVAEVALQKWVTESKKKIYLEETAARANSVSDLISSFGILNQAAKGSAKVSKGIATASAIIDTYAAANKALASGPPPWNFIAMAAVIASGLANVTNIQKQKFKHGVSDFIVPPGYQNDSYTIGVSSGEKVNVTPAHQTNNNNSNATFNVNINTSDIDEYFVKAKLIPMLQDAVKRNRIPLYATQVI